MSEHFNVDDLEKIKKYLSKRGYSFLTVNYHTNRKFADIYVFKFHELYKVYVEVLEFYSNREYKLRFNLRKGDDDNDYIHRIDGPAQFYMTDYNLRSFFINDCQYTLQAYWSRPDTILLEEDSCYNWYYKAKTIKAGFGHLLDE